MPLIYNDTPSTTGEVWFPSKCLTKKSDTEEYLWNLRHAALSVDDWTGESAKIYDWITSPLDSQCGVLLEAERHAAESSDTLVSLGNAYKASLLRTEADLLRAEFDALSKKWNRETRHISLISKKVAHPAYLRIIGMGEAAIPLLLEALRDKPMHWFAALRATANSDPSSAEANPAQARNAWLRWGRLQGYID